MEEVKCILPEVGAIAHGKTTDMAPEKTPTVGALLEAQALDREFWVSAQAVGFPCSLFKHTHNTVLVRQSLAKSARQMSRTVTIRACIPYISFMVRR